jgi:hypothetical protein
MALPAAVRFERGLELGGNRNPLRLGGSGRNDHRYRGCRHQQRRGEHRARHAGASAWDAITGGHDVSSFFSGWHANSKTPTDTDRAGSRLVALSFREITTLRRHGTGIECSGRGVPGQTDCSSNE